MSTIKANPKGGVITLTKKNETIYLGKGADIIRGGADSGNHIIYNYDGSKDIFEIAKGTKLTNDMQSYSLVGNDIILKLGKTRITLKNMLNKAVRNRWQGSNHIDKMNPYRCLPKNISYAKNGSKYDWTKIVTNANFYNGKAEMDEYNDNLKILDARKTNKGWLYIEGSKRNDVIYTASGNCDCKVRAGNGNDTIYLGKASDRVIVDTDDGNDVLYGFDSNRDRVELANSKLTKGVLGYSMIGNDLQLRLGKTKLTLKNMVNKSVTLSWQGNYAGNNYRFYDNQPKNVSYAKNGKTTDWTKAIANKNFSGHYYDMGEHNENLKTFDARAVSKKIDITGRRRKDDVIYIGKGGSDRIFARSGNDTIYCGSGKDVIWFEKDDGKDTIINSGKNDVAYLYSTNNINQVTAKLSKGVMTLGLKGTNDTLSISGWKAGSSLSTVQLGNGLKYSLSANGKFTKK